MRTISWIAVIAAIACAASSDPSTIERAAAPTFSPPSGTYASAQTVAISSATPGAVIRCTQDGSIPTGVSPACAAPIVVSSTTTLRAIATATGYTDSGVASATYVIGESNDATKLQAFAAKRSWFCHMSVGGNVYRGELLDDASGLGRIIADHPTAGCSILHVRSWYADTADLAAIPPGAWAHSTPNPVEGYPDFRGNGYPIDKINFFVWMLGDTFGGGLDYAGLKFCYSDVESFAQAEETWAAYRAAMDALEASYPGRLIYWTVPVVASWEPGNEDNEWLSQRIRETYGSTGRVFDVADWESRDPSGALVLGANGHRKLNAAWEAPDRTHLNAAGADWVAQHYLDFMYQVEVGAAASARSGTSR